MRKHTYIGMLAAMVLLAACNEQPEITILNKGELALTARTESSTKTVVTDETFVYWEPGDEIVVFAGDERSQFTTDLEAPAAMAVFKGTFSKDLAVSDLWALYPYNADATFDGEHITTTIPATQNARAGSFAKGMNISVAHSSGTDLQFYNVGGGLRFSVTEEGVKKVIFEGLDGETIAGTVTIGFEEGLPKVTGVTSGSQFITLLPPDGETFRTNTWYFIVAIPGALEKGYKLRFYKTDDYARRVTEKAVTIVRSIYGSVAAADGGQTYEPTIKSAPETKEEWEESIVLTNQIVSDVSELLWQDGDPEPTPTEDLIQEIRLIEGVQDAAINFARTGIAVRQNDGIWVNFQMDAANKTKASFPSSSDAKPSVVVSYPKTKASSGIYHLSNEEISLNSQKRALFLAPFQHQFYDQKNIQLMKDCLVEIGFKEENIDVYVDRLVILKYFTGDFLSNYDFIYISTHGGTGYTMYMVDNDNDGYMDRAKEVTTLGSYIPYKPELADSFIENGILDKSEVAIMTIGVDEDGDGKNEKNDPFLAMTPDFLHDAKFNNSCIILNACHSAELCEENHPGSMVWRFLNAEAGIVSGFSSTTMTNNDWSIVQTVDLMSKGISFQDATDIIKNSQIAQGFSESAYLNMHEIDPQKYTDTTRQWFLFHEIYQYFNKTNSPYHLARPPYPELNTVTSSESTFEFSWSCYLHPFVSGSDGWEFGWDYHFEKEYRTEFYTVSYDVYVDSVRIPDGAVQVADAKALWPVSEEGEHSWYVVANLIEQSSGHSLISYQSEVGHFTVEQTASAAEISVSPSSFLLEQREIGVVSERTLTITNSGSGQLQISSVTCTERVSTDFDLWTETSIPAGESRTLTVKYTRPSAGYYRGSITINSNASNNSAQTVTISGTTLEITTPDAVDIGLSVKWGSRNLGASKPEDRGLFYAWGETETKDCYGANTYKWYNGSNLYDAGTILKYNAMEGTSSYDGKSVLDAEDDVAHVKLGGNWRMPTQKEVQELKATRNDSNYTWEWIDKKGWKVTYIPNGNSIFLPLSGYRTGWPDSSGFPSGTDYGYFWTSSIRADYPFEAWFAMFRSSYFQIDTGGAMYGRDKGLPIRPVCK